MRRVALAMLLVVVACSTDAATTVQAGRLALTLTTAGTTDGAIVVLVSGGPVLSVSALAGYQLASNTDALGTHIMIVGNVGSGVLATLQVPDVSRASAYVATVEQVADRSSFGLLDPARDQVTVGPTR
ncbi:MAG: hypothetical protein ACRELE_11980 [Gemmatimonadales bacterium]